VNVAESLCQAFCESLEVNQIPAGLAVGTPFQRSDGDKVGFFLVQGDGSRWRLEDDGLSVPLLTASGVNIETGQRSEEFTQLIDECGVVYDPENGELRTDWLDEATVPQAAFKFVTCLLRIQDLLLLQPKRIATTFRDDALKAITERFQGRAEMSFEEPVVPSITDIPADVVICANGRPPLGVFIATSDSRVWQAITARTTAIYQFNEECKIVALFEYERAGLPERTQQQARNRLDAAPSFRGDPHGAMQKLAEEAFDLAADASAYPEQLNALEPWKPTVLYHNTSSWWDKSLLDLTQEELAENLKTSAYFKYGCVGAVAPDIFYFYRISEK